jgi:hypothetical protein
VVHTVRRTKDLRARDAGMKRATTTRHDAEAIRSVFEAYRDAPGVRERIQKKRTRQTDSLFRGTILAGNA